MTLAIILLLLHTATATEIEGAGAAAEPTIPKASADGSEGKSTALTSAAYNPLGELLQERGPVAELVLLYLGGDTILPRAEWTHTSHRMVHETDEDGNRHSFQPPAPTEERWFDPSVCPLLIARFGSSGLTDFTSATVCRAWGQMRWNMLARHIADNIETHVNAYRTGPDAYRQHPDDLAALVPADHGALSELPPAVTVTNFRWNFNHQGFGNRGMDANGLYILAGTVYDGRPVYERYCLDQSGNAEAPRVRDIYWIEYEAPREVRHWEWSRDVSHRPARWLLRAARDLTTSMQLMGRGRRGSVDVDDVLPPTDWPYTGEFQIDSTNHTRGGAPMHLHFHHTVESLEAVNIRKAARASRKASHEVADAKDAKEVADAKDAKETADVKDAKTN